MAVKRPEGIFPYVSTDAWSEKLAEAIQNTCEQEGVTPPPSAAIVEGLATALGDTEIKKLVVTQRTSNSKVLATSAYRVVKAGEDKVLLLTCHVHGAGVAPWDLNDRTASFWTPPSPEATERVKALVDAEFALEEARKAEKQAEKAREARRRAVDDDIYAAAELAAAEDKYRAATSRVSEAQRERDALLSSLGNRRPRPVVKSAEEDGRAMAALVLAPQPREVAVHLQRYAVENLRRAGRGRGYDLVESLVAAGQLSRGMCVLQQWQLQDQTGQTSKSWRMVAVTANNRALARLDIFDLQVEHLVTGMPQSLYPYPRENTDSELLLHNQREVLNRISYSLNGELAAEGTDRERPAHRAGRIADVPTEVVVGCSNPAALEHLLRALNVDDHLRGIQPYDEDARLIALFAILIDAYATEGLLVRALAETFPEARGADRLNVDGVRSALTANGPLAPLSPLVPPGDEISPVALRDIALRSITALVFPDLPAAPPKTGQRQVRDTGRYWPIVRGALQEPAWSQTGAKTAAARTKLWSAAVAQLSMHRANILSAHGLFATADTKEGARQDPRSLRDLFLGAQAGDATAWAALVQRMVPNLIHAPEPLITPGQGSEAGGQRKGERRGPANAVAALKMAYKQEAPNVTRELLLSFAKAVLENPDATETPEAPDGTRLICYGEQTWPEESRTTIVPGMILAPDTEGQPTALVVDKAWFDELFPPTWGSTFQGGSSRSATTGTTGSADQADEDRSSDDTSRAAGGVAADPRAQLGTLRKELPAKIELVEGVYERAVQAADALLSDFETARRLRSDLGEDPLPADQRIEWMEKLTKARGAAEASISALNQVEALILKL
ncbi:hypothetical protein [Streptomyces parvus]|uniref:hypothetical protein n=1 Tax=Streptomyces parvus TaxID=66428 RepID=UPI0036250D7D